MSSEGTKILKVIQYWKSDKLPSIIYADLEFLIKNVDWCQHNLGKSSTTKVVQHIPCRYSVSTIWTFDGIQNKYNVYRGKDCTKKFWEPLRKLAIMITVFEKKKVIPLTK